MKTITILLIEDNSLDIRLIKEMLFEIRTFNYNLVSAVTLKEGCEQISKNNFDIILLDLNLPDSTGQQTFEKVIDCCKEIPVVLITGNEDQELSVKLIMEGAQDYITKQSLNSSPLEKSILYSIERQALLSNIKLKNVQIDRIEKERILLAKFPSQYPDPVLRIAINGKLLYINEAGIKLLTDWQLIINETIPFWLKDIIDPIFIEGTNIEFELCHREFIYSFYAVPLIEEAYINLYGRDITEHKLAEESLLKLKKAIYTSGEAIFLTDREGVFTFVNPAFTSLYGFSSDEIVDKVTPRIIKSGVLDRSVYENFWQTLLNGDEVRGELINKKKDGTLIHIDGSATPILDEENKIIGFLGIQRDITERKQVEERLREQSDAMEAAIDGLAILDTDQNYIYMNKSHAGIYGYDYASELIGASWRVLYDTEELQRFDQEILPELNQKGHYQGMARGKKKNGSVFPQALSLTALVNGGLICTVRDITERNREELELIIANKELVFQNEEKEKRAEELIIANKELVFQNKEKEKRAVELIIAKEKAEESDRLKTAFLNNISHEIRTPFNGILGFLSIIQDDELPVSEKDEYISIINQSSDRLMNTINEIVEISQIQAGQMQVTASETNIKKLIGELFDRFKNDAESKGLEFNINNHLPENLECISTDSIKLKTILSNLIDNAIKFTKAGSIEFDFSKNGDHLEFSIKDTGIGIPENKQQIIFERFMQADVSRIRQFEGLGLGLSIAKSYVEMLGGKIWVESEIRKGSTFYFTIPYNTEPEGKEVINNVVPQEV